MIFYISDRVVSLICQYQDQKVIGWHSYLKQLIMVGIYVCTCRKPIALDHVYVFKRDAEGSLTVGRQCQFSCQHYWLWFI